MTDINTATITTTPSFPAVTRTSSRPTAPTSSMDPTSITGSILSRSSKDGSKSTILSASALVTTTAIPTLTTPPISTPISTPTPTPTSIPDPETTPYITPDITPDITPIITPEGPPQAPSTIIVRITRPPPQPTAASPTSFIQNKSISTGVIVVIVLCIIVGGLAAFYFIRKWLHRRRNSRAAISFDPRDIADFPSGDGKFGGDLFIGDEASRHSKEPTYDNGVVRERIAPPGSVHFPLPNSFPRPNSTHVTSANPRQSYSFDDYSRYPVMNTIGAPNGLARTPSTTSTEQTTDPYYLKNPNVAPPVGLERNMDPYYLARSYSERTLPKANMDPGTVSVYTDQRNIDPYHPPPLTPGRVSPPRRKRVPEITKSMLPMSNQPHETDSTGGRSETDELLAAPPQSTDQPSKRETRVPRSSRRYSAGSARSGLPYYPKALKIANP